MTDFSIEKSINGPVIGLDEVGRGPLAGPVVSCGCLFNRYDRLPENIQITDSKKHTAKQRQKLFSLFKKLQEDKIIEFHLGFASVNEIDEFNILEATKLSMKRVLDKFNNTNLNIIIDGNFSLNYKNIYEKSVIGGDKISVSIATASIIAKVHRDRLMSFYDRKFREDGWQKNSGYGTKQHINAIYKNGITDQHRKTFEPIKSLFKKIQHS